MKKKKLILIISKVFKTFLLFFFIYYIIYTNFSFENNASLLAISEFGNQKVGGIVDLDLGLERGTGEIYINLDSIKEVDTQASILFSKKIICDLFNPNCNNYDYYFNFKSNSEILKGPSAGATITMLIANSLNRKKFPEDVAITGSINPGGIIGNVDGINEKVKAARNIGKKRIIIPYLGNYTLNLTDVKIYRAIDIFEVYEIINNVKINKSYEELDTSTYEKGMKELALEMCKNSKKLDESIKIIDIEEIINSNNSNTNLISKLEIVNETDKELKQNYNNFKKSLKNGLEAIKERNYYSAGSFCFNSNINGRYITLYKEFGLNKTKFKILYENFKQDYLKKFIEINKQEYINNIKTKEDLYVYFILLDRINDVENNLDAVNLSKNISKNDIYRLAYSIERLKTVYLWEKLITHKGELIELNDQNFYNGCNLLIKEASLKNEYLKRYGLNNDKEIEKLRKSGSYYLCIYSGLELIGRENTIINLFGVNEKQLNDYIDKIINITYDRILLNSKNNNNFPILPYIYYEYSKDLRDSGDIQSSFMYANYALSFNEVDYYLNTNNNLKKKANNMFIHYIFNNKTYLILLLIAFYLF